MTPSGLREAVRRRRFSTQRARLGRFHYGFGIRADGSGGYKGPELECVGRIKYPDGLDAPLHRPPWPNRKRSRMMKKKVPDLTDKHVGARMRMRRMMLKMSQEKLGDALGLTFQQVQKYEKGTNRIGASRLQQISHILQGPVAFFFEGAPTTELGGVNGMSEAPSPAYVADFLASTEGLALIKAFTKVKEAKL